jgi:hypothetical protein
MANAAKITLTTGDAPATPSAGTLTMYSKTDNRFYKKNSDGEEQTIGGQMSYTEAATDSLSLAQCDGGVIDNVGQSGNVILTLPAAAANLYFTITIGVTAAFYYRILTLNAANDKIYLDGVAGSDDGYVQVASAAVGNCIQFFTIQTAAGVYDWYACTVSGVWVAG